MKRTALGAVCGGITAFFGFFLVHLVWIDLPALKRSEFQPMDGRTVATAFLIGGCLGGILAGVWGGRRLPPLLGAMLKGAALAAGVCFLGQMIHSALTPPKQAEGWWLVHVLPFALPAGAFAGWLYADPTGDSVEQREESDGRAVPVNRSE